MADTYKDQEGKNFKFRELKAYASTEWLAENKKKYRQVFDRYKTSYIYAELSFYNKLFDQEDWEIDVELKCFSLRKGRSELCNLPFKRKVSKYDSVVYIREGWGNKKEGNFWKKGTYYWEAWIQGKKAATKYFYVEDGSSNAHDDNGYVQVQSLKLYEGPYDDVIEEDRVNMKEFASGDARYIYAEIILKNLNPDQSWQCELFTKFYNNARELKGQVIRLQRIEKNDEFIKITAGWGSNVKGSWRVDNYTAEVIFMDELLAYVPFEVGDEFVQGTSNVYLPNQESPLLIPTDEDADLNFEEVMEKMDALIGLKEIKIKVREHAQYIKFLQLRKEKGFEETEDINVHSVFVGNPGTGKTTVAKMMGKLYKKMGLLSKGHVHEVDRVDLVGEYIGQTAPKVKDAIEKARGGVLFVDEAYALARSNDDSKDFGREVIEILIKEMSNGKGDMAVIMAGYPKEMNHMLDSNPGLKSRFKHFFEFSDYVPDELYEIGEYAAKAHGVQFTETALTKFNDIIVKAYRDRDRTFGNARFVFDLVEKAKIKLGLRVMDSDSPTELEPIQLAEILSKDVDLISVKPEKELPDIPIDYSLLEQSMADLDNLIGMTKVKEQIKEMVRLVQFYKESNKNVLNSFFLHTVFVGNPGTGKTTVARILTSIYKALGILERGHMIETDRQGLVAGFVGQTAIKTANKVEEAMGGVLFIDEAYALSQARGGAHGDFGDEAIQTLLKRMEDHRGEFFLFVAGYPSNMETFLKTNPGLNSRFDRILKFEDYNPDELLDISLGMFSEQRIQISSPAKKHLRSYLEFVHDMRDKYFGNARTVRQIVDEAIKNMNLRLADTPMENRKPQSTLTLADVKSFKLSKEDSVFEKKSIGFRNR